MKPLAFKTSGFTLAELVIVVAIVGIIAGFGITNFQRTVEKNYERVGIQNLVSIHGAEERYKSQNGTYWPPNAATCGGTCLVAPVNAALKLNLQNDSNLTYTCAYDAGVSYLCYAARAGGAWTISIQPGTIVPPGNPKCVTAGTCPSL